MTDNEEGNEGVSQNMTFHGIGVEGIKKLITIVRIGGPPFSIMRYVNNLISVPIFKAIIKKASQSSRIADKPLLSKHAMAGWNVSEGICRDNVNFLTAPLCEKPSIIAHQTGLC